MKRRNSDPTATGELDVPTLIDRHGRLVTVQRRLLLAGIVALTVLNLAVAGISARTLHVIGDALADSPAQTRQVLLVIDCRRQADLERLADELDLTVRLVDPRCTQLPEELHPGQ